MTKIEKKLRKIAKYASIAANLYRHDRVLLECRKRHLSNCISDTRTWKALDKLDDAISELDFDFGMHHINQMADENYNRTPKTCQKYRTIAKRFGITEDPEKTYF